MKFDWYQASVPEVSPQVVMEALSKSDYYGDWQESRASKGYDVGAEFKVADQVLFRIDFGGQNEEYGANVKATGGAAPKLAETLRSNFPEHRVSRLDACEDFHHEQVYDYLRKRALKIAKDQKVKAREIVKPLAECDDGRTLYLGSESSAISMRIYEKGKQLGVGTEWVRAELQVRPQKEMKSVLAKLEPLQVWGIAKWSHSMALQMGNKNLQRVDVEIYKPSDRERAYRFMLKQYGKVFLDMLETHGSWETVGAQIGLDLAEIDMPLPTATLTKK